MSGSVTAPAHLTVVTPGRMESMTQEGQTRTWHFAATCPQLTLGLFAAEYACETFPVGPATVEFYFSPRHETYIRAAGVTDRIRDILEFYQELIGPFPFDDMPLKIVETSVYKPGGHASLNVVTMAEYLLNRAKVSDPNTDPRYILRDLKILAHELGHQWWGSGVAIDESGAWSSEGLTEYVTYQYLAARCPATFADIIPHGWRGSIAQGKYAYWRKDPAALDRMRPALREKLLAGQAKGDAYSVLPVRLLEAEERIGKEAVRARLAEIFRRYRGNTLDWQDFVAVMGPGIDRSGKGATMNTIAVIGWELRRILLTRTYLYSLLLILLLSQNTLGRLIIDGTYGTAPYSPVSYAQFLVHADPAAVDRPDALVRGRVLREGACRAPDRALDPDHQRRLPGHQDGGHRGGLRAHGGSDGGRELRVLRPAVRILRLSGVPQSAGGVPAPSGGLHPGTVPGGGPTAPPAASMALSRWSSSPAWCTWACPSGWTSAATTSCSIYPKILMRTLGTGEMIYYLPADFLVSRVGLVLAGVALLGWAATRRCR